MTDVQALVARGGILMSFRSGRLAVSAVAAAAFALAGCDGETNGTSTALEARDAAPGADGVPAVTEVVTFAAAEPAAAGDRSPGRLPGEGELAIYVPATDLFPGAARIQPAIDNPYSGNEQAIRAGERHFAAFNCAGCHAPLGGGGMGPPLSDADWIYGSEPAQIYLSIMHGRPAGMPAWSSMLPQQTTWELVAYIETLSEIDDYAAELGFESRDSPGRAQPDPDAGGGTTAGNGGQ